MKPDIGPVTVLGKPWDQGEWAKHMAGTPHEFVPIPGAEAGHVCDRKCVCDECWLRKSAKVHRRRRG